jgi:polysaccharide biosynthesis protein PslH
MRVLFLTHRLPYAPDRGDRVRAYHLLRHLREYADVDLISLAHSRDEAARTADLSSLVTTARAVTVPRWWNLVRGIAHLPGRTPLTHVLLDAPAVNGAITETSTEHPPDVIFAYCSGMARFALHPAIATIPLVFDMVDVDSLKWSALSERSRPPLRWVYAREARTLARFEGDIVTRAEATLITTSRERDALAEFAPVDRVTVVENGVDVATLRPSEPPAATADVVFCGVMDYQPNVEAVLWMAEQVWPLVRRRYPTARFKIVGSSPTPRVAALAAPERGILVTGYVPDVRPELWSSALSVAPLQVSRGIQNKVLEAAAAGLPVVTTSHVAGGLPAAVVPACIVEDAPDEFAAAICNLLALEPAGRRSIANRAELWTLTWPERLRPVRALLESIVSR